MNIEISKTKIPKKFWICEFWAKHGEDETVVMALMHNVPIDKYYFAIDASKTNLPHANSENLNDPVFMEKSGDEFMQEVVDLYQKSGLYQGARFEKVMIENSTDIEKIVEEMIKTNLFNINTVQSEPKKKVEITFKPEAELQDLVKKFKPKDLKEMISKISIPTLRSQYGDEAINRFLEKIKYVEENTK